MELPTGTTTDTPVATLEPTTTPEPATPIDATSALSEMSATERQTWRETGALPDRVAVDKPVEAGAVPAVKPVSKRQQEINEHIRRATAAELEVKELKAEVARWKTAPTAQIGAPPKAEPVAPVVDAKEPALDDFLDQADPYLAYTKAVAKWETTEALKAADRTRAETDAKARDDAAGFERFRTYQTREVAFKATVPDFDAKTLPVRQALDLRSPLSLALMDSPVAPQLILHFAEHPDDFARLGSLGMTALPLALRELGKLEARFESPASPAAAAATTNLVPHAPAPPTQLGTRPAVPADEVEGALSRGDFSAYRDAANRRELAGKR